MQNKFTIEEIKKALKQAEANINFEEIDLKKIINKNVNTNDKQKIKTKGSIKNDR